MAEICRKQKKALNNFVENKKSKMAKSESSSKRNVTEIFRKVLFAVLLVAIFYPPYVRGLYFEKEQLPTEVLIFSLFSLFWVYKWIKNDRVFLKTPIEYASFAIVSVYLITTFIAVNLRLAILEWLKYCMFFAVFFIFSDIVKAYKEKLIVLWCIIVSAIGICILGFDGATGAKISSMINSRFPADNPLFFDLFKDGRIFSTFQYPNALASYLMAVFFVVLGLLNASSQKWQKVIASTCGFVILTTFIFTLSRGAYLMFPLVLFVYFLTFPKGMRLKGIIYSLIIIIITALFSIEISRYMTSSTQNGIKIWTLLLLGAFITSIAILLIDYLIILLEKLGWKVYVSISAVLIGLIGTIIYIALTTPSALVLDNSAAKEATNFEVQKSIVLTPDKEYKLQFSVDANNNNPANKAYNISIVSRNKSDILFNKGTSLLKYDGKSTNSNEVNELLFTVPSESIQTKLYFSNNTKGSKVTFDKVKIIEKSSNKTIKEIILKYKYLPETVASRIDEGFTVSESVVQREQFYNDGLKSVKEYPILGAGGGAWKDLYFKYQSYLYWTAETHNYILQVGIECGVIGIIILVIFILSIILMFLTEYFQKKSKDAEELLLQGVLFTAIFSLFIHSIIDFDLSLASIFLVFWVLIALFNNSFRNSNTERINEHDRSLLKSISGFFGSIKNGVAFRVHPLIAIVFTIIILMFPVRLVFAEEYSKMSNEAIAKSDLDNAIKYLDEAVNLDFLSLDYKIKRIHLLLRNSKKISQSDLEKIENKVKELEAPSKNSPGYTSILGELYYNLGIMTNNPKHLEKSISLFNTAINLRPLRPEEWENKINTYYHVAMYYFKNRDIDSALRITNEALGNIDAAKKVNQKNLNPFVFNTRTSEYIEKLKYIKDNINGTKAININNIFFYSIPEMDVNNDAIPDQWGISSRDEAKIFFEGELMNVENIDAAKSGFIRSRYLKLESDKSYRIEVELNNSSEISGIPFVISGVTDNTDFLRPDGNIFRAIIKTPSSFDNGENYLVLWLNGARYNIKTVQIIKN